jgi:hypothetical protein
MEHIKNQGVRRMESKNIRKLIDEFKKQTLYKTVVMITICWFLKIIELETIETC